MPIILACLAGFDSVALEFFYWASLAIPRVGVHGYTATL